MKGKYQHCWLLQPHNYCLAQLLVLVLLLDLMLVLNLLLDHVLHTKKQNLLQTRTFVRPITIQ